MVEGGLAGRRPPPALVAGRKQRGRQSRRRAGHATSIADAQPRSLSHDMPRMTTRKGRVVRVMNPACAKRKKKLTKPKRNLAPINHCNGGG